MTEPDGQLRLVGIRDGRRTTLYWTRCDRQSIRPEALHANAQDILAVLYGILCLHWDRLATYQVVAFVDDWRGSMIWSAFADDVRTPPDDPIPWMHAHLVP